MTQTQAIEKSKQLYRTSDGKIYAYADWDKGITHQLALEANGDNRGCTISMDGGENWDWEYGYIDQNKKRTGWFRRGERR